MSPAKIFTLVDSAMQYRRPRVPGPIEMGALPDRNDVLQDRARRTYPPA